MTYLQTFKTGVCFSALIAGTAAQADVTATEVWENWKSSLSIYGDSGVTIGSEDITGGTVTVSGIQLAMSDDVSNVAAEMGEMTFTENGDGTVAITMAPTSTISITGEDDVVVNLTLTHSGLDMTASGTPELISYDLKADQYAIIVDSITEADGTAVPADIRFTLNDLSGKYDVTEGDLRSIAYAMSMGSMDLLVDVKDPEGNGNALVSGKINGLFVNADMSLPADMDLENPEDLMASGFSISADYGLEGADYLFDITDAGDQVSGSMSNGAATIDVSFDATALSYKVESRDIALNLTAAQMPFPVTASLSAYDMGVTMPLSKTDDPTDFGLLINLADLSVNDEIWMMADPAGALSHEPVTIRLDLSGTAKLLFDIMDPSQAEAMAMAEVPGEIYSLNLNDLTLIAAGASIDGAGGFVFDNTDLTTIPGVPRPEGQITLNINGANQLIDTLVSMGLLPEDQAMMGRMMMGMFARTVGEDQLTSTIEINDQGHILANGQRIQ